MLQDMNRNDAIEKSVGKRQSLLSISGHHLDVRNTAAQFRRDTFPQIERVIVRALLRSQTLVGQMIAKPRTDFERAPEAGPRLGYRVSMLNRLIAPYRGRRYSSLSHTLMNSSRIRSRSALKGGNVFGHVVIGRV